MSCYAKHLSYAALCALALVACKPDDEPATQLIVSINSNLAIGTELTRVRIEVKETAGNRTSTPRTFNLSTSSGGVKFPFSFGVTKGSAERVTVIATGFGPLAGSSEGAVIERKENARFRDGKALLLKIFLDDVCSGNVCGATQTCQQSTARLTRPGQCDIIREPALTPITPGDEDDAWDEGDSGAGGASGQGGASGEGGSSGQGGQGGSSGAAGESGQGGTGGTPSLCNPPCGPGEECLMLTCMCTDNFYFFYADTDRDGFGDPANELEVCGDNPPSGYVSNDLDCCDGDPDVNPDVTLPSFIPSLCGDGSDGNADWDHNCDGTIEGYQVTWAGECCNESIGWVNGWIGMPPYCGQSGSVNVCDEDLTCEFEMMTALQECL